MSDGQASTLKRYTSEAVDVTFDGARCIHAAECVRGLPAVFDTQKRPWIDPTQAGADAIVEVVLRCPSGALHFERKDGGAAEGSLPPLDPLRHQVAVDVVRVEDAEGAERRGCAAAEEDRGGERDAREAFRQDVHRGALTS